MVARVVAEKVMVDPRNAPYLPWMFAHMLLCPSLFAWAWHRYSIHGLEVWAFLLYHLLRLSPHNSLFAFHHVLIHKEGHNHKGFFKGGWRIFNYSNQFFVGLFYGSIPLSYEVAHNKIHHRWHNDVDDVHTNLDMDRTKFQNYILWLPRFFLYWTGVSPVLLFLKRGEYRLAAKMLFGMCFFYGYVALIAKCFGTVFCLAYVLYPHLESICFLGAIAYLWHSFVDPKDPTNQYVNSITILDGHFNCFNEDYHVVHHHFPGVHWTDAPAQYEKDKSKYAACTATIFENTEEGELLYMMFAGKWDMMASHFVDLNGKLTHAEKKALILERLSFVASDGGTKASARDLLRQPGTVPEKISFASWGTSKVRDWDDGKQD